MPRHIGLSRDIVCHFGRMPLGLQCLRSSFWACTTASYYVCTGWQMLWNIGFERGREEPKFEDELTVAKAPNPILPRFKLPGFPFSLKQLKRDTKKN